MHFIRFSMSVILCVLTVSVDASSTRDRACPDDWRSSSVSIPMIGAGTNPWGSSGSDKAQAKAHLSESEIVETVDVNPVTADALVNDLLTVASECAAQRSYQVNQRIGYFGPPPEEDEPHQFTLITVGGIIVVF